MRTTRATRDWREQSLALMQALIALLQERPSFPQNPPSLRVLRGDALPLQRWAYAIEMYLKVRVHFRPNGLVVNGVECDGVYAPITRRIQVVSTMPPARQAYTLLHEGAHVCLHSNPDDLDKDALEAEIEADSAAALAAELLGIEGALEYAWYRIVALNAAEAAEQAVNMLTDPSTQVRILRTANTLVQAVRRSPVTGSPHLGEPVAPAPRGGYR